MTDLHLSTVHSHLVALYGISSGEEAFARLRAILDSYRSRLTVPSGNPDLSERDSVLITYADQLREPGRSPLQTLGAFAERYIAGLVSTIHILPFYPYSSDDGFSVIDYRAVNPAFGSWEDISRLGERFRLMFDAVINHCSIRHEWFLAFLRDDPAHRDYFVVVEDGSPDLSQVVRPRALPLLTEFQTASGPRQVWTTFSDDQVDLNFQNPDVLLEIVDTLLFYVERGAGLIRLDAIAYLWKEIGTSCIHLPQTHRIIQLLRTVLDAVAPHVLLITETNVPHLDNISYFGDGRNEAQLVYNFALPPLVLHTFHTGNSRVLSEWAAGLALPSAQTTFFNFLASHDGIGVNPARGILPDSEIDAIVEKVLRHGGLVSYKHDASGAQIPYELNINYFDALSDPAADEPLETQVDRFMAAQAIMLVLVGVPGIYFHSLFGSRSWQEGVQVTGRNRTINRQKFELTAFEHELNDESSIRRHVFDRFAQLLKARSASRAFHPHGRQQVLDVGEAVFALLRISPEGEERVLCLHNISDRPVGVQTDDIATARSGPFVDLIRNREMIGSLSQWSLEPYQTLWLRF
jgi:glucosylglycerate phosphorylase